VNTDLPPCAQRPLLDQLAALIARLDPTDYRHLCLRLGGGSPGGHVRHCIEFYQCFLDGFEGGRIDYDGRRRDPALENDPDAARAALSEIATRLARDTARMPADFPLHVRECGTTWLPSTHARESRFLHSHTVHHMALVAVLLRARDLPVPADFGVAPATLQHRANCRT